MRFIIILLLTAALACLALQLMPWWITALISFLLCLAWPLRQAKAFLATGCGAALGYGLLCLMADQANMHILSTRMAALFQLPSYILMILLTMLTGFITAGLGGWAGAALHYVFRPVASKEPAAGDAPAS